MEDIIVKENFFDQNLIKNLWQECQEIDHKGEDFIDQHGIWKGQLVSRQNFIKRFKIGIDTDTYDDCSPSLQEVIKKVYNFFDNKIAIREISYQQLYLPWDIHCDLTKNDIHGNDVYKSEHKDNYVPFYNVLIPLHDVDSSTIMFEQSSIEHNDFWIYKKNNPKVTNPVPQEIWDEHLDMCWPEDRLWLSIKQIMPKQKAGQLVAFRRHYFHSSDNFHKRNIKCKHFIQFLLDKKTGEL